MRAGEHQGESAVGDRIALVCHRLNLVDDQRELLLCRRTGLTSANGVGLPPPRRRQEPRVRIVRHALERPRAQSRGERVAKRVLGAGDVASADGEQRDEATVALARYALRNTASLACRHQPFCAALGSKTGRISIDPYLLEGHRLAQTMASSTLGTSTKK